MNVHVTLLGVILLTIAGCLGPSGAPTIDSKKTNTEIDPEKTQKEADSRIADAPESQPATANLTANATPKYVLVYNFSGTLTGISPPEQPAHSETFEAPTGLVGMSWRMEYCVGGTFHFRILDPNGNVFTSTGERAGTGPLGGGLCMSVGSHELMPDYASDDPVQPGTYTVEYWVNGQTEIAKFCVFAALDEKSKSPPCPG